MCRGLFSGADESAGTVGHIWNMHSSLLISLCDHFILNVQMFRTVTGLKGIVGSVANVRCLCVILCIMTKLLNVTPETHETFLLTCCDRA